MTTTNRVNAPLPGPCRVPRPGSPSCAERPLGRGFVLIPGPLVQFRQGVRIRRF